MNFKVGDIVYFNNQPNSAHWKIVSINKKDAFDKFGASLILYKPSKIHGYNFSVGQAGWTNDINAARSVKPRSHPLTNIFK